MGKRSNIALLPPLVRELIERDIEREGFANFQAIAAKYRPRWKVSKSALHRHAQKMERVRAAARMEVETAKYVGDPAGWLIGWARRHPKDAERLVKRLRIKEEQQQKEGQS